MRRILFILIFQAFLINIYSQNLNGYKYVYVPTLSYENKSQDIWGISTNLRTMFSKKGFVVINEFSNLNEASKNPCAVLQCLIDHTAFFEGTNTVTITLQDCNGKIVLKSFGDFTSKQLRNTDLIKATNKAFSVIEKISYIFNPSETPELVLPKVEILEETEESLTKYFDTTNTKEIEGIFKSYDDGSFYKFGVKRFGNKYKAIIIESNNYWKPGEVKTIFEESTIKGLYPTKWFMADKTQIETLAFMETPSILNIELKNPETGVKEIMKFIKLYPLNNTTTPKKNNEIKAYGSGFFINSSGLIATNAHVIKNAKKIELNINNDSIAEDFTASVLLIDESNDLAILKITDKKFSSLNSLPYRIISDSEIGEDVFTIGFPLNDIMGSNYKVTNGIISSNTGLKDDIRFIQITAPIQPGNSGGPLFNKNGNVIGITTSKLNGQAIGTNVENVNYAIKARYLIALINKIDEKLITSKNSELKDKDLKEKVKILKNYVCLIKVF